MYTTINTINTLLSYNKKELFLNSKDHFNGGNPFGDVII